MTPLTAGAPASGTLGGPSDPRSYDRRSAVIESIVLPLLFWTVAGAGGFRMTVTGEMRFLPPSLFVLVLSGLLVGALVQAGLVRPAERVFERATLLEGMAGAVLIVSLFAATAQLLNGLLPEQGLLALLFNLFFAILLTNTMAAEPDARRLLRSVAVTFGWALLMKYVLLAGLDAPEPGLTARLARAVVRGATLGGLPLDPWSPIVGYVMFASAAAYLGGLWLLGRAAVTAAKSMPPPPSS